MTDQDAWQQLQLARDGDDIAEPEDCVALVQDRIDRLQAAGQDVKLLVDMLAGLRTMLASQRAAREMLLVGLRNGERAKAR